MFPLHPSQLLADWGMQQVPTASNKQVRLRKPFQEATQLCPQVPRWGWGVGWSRGPGSGATHTVGPECFKMSEDSPFAQIHELP